MEGRKSMDWRRIAAAVGGMLAILLMTVALMGQGGAQDDSAATPLPPTRVVDPAVCVVNEGAVGVNFWVEMARAYRLMVTLSGGTSSSPEETLEYLIDQELILQAAPQAPPRSRVVEAEIAELQQTWGMEEEELAEALDTAGLEREVLEQAVERMLMVEQALEDLEATGTSIEAWLAEQRQQAEIICYEERVEVVLATLGPMPTPTPSYPQAPDFTLRRADGGRLNLYEQLSEGPVVLVFFEKCG